MILLRLKSYIPKIQTGYRYSLPQIEMNSTIREDIKILQRANNGEMIWHP